MTLYLGCPMWALKGWVGNFFPPKTRQRDFLSLYSRRLNTVEGNTTFYSIPGASAVERWVQETPPGFRFCLKFPQVISHRRRLRGAEAETAQFVECLGRLGDRCGPAFLQLPPSFAGPHLPVLAEFLAGLPAEHRYAVEVRHHDFFDGPAEVALDGTLRERGVARVVFDTRGLRSAVADDGPTLAAQERKPDVPVRFTRTAPFAFIRFVTTPGLPENEALWAEWADHVAGWLAAGDDVFFFLHSPDDRHSPSLAREFHARVSERHPLPPLPKRGDDPPQQAKLL